MHWEVRQAALVAELAAVEVVAAQGQQLEVVVAEEQGVDRCCIEVQHKTERLNKE